MNVSKMGLSGVLMLNGQVVACASRRIIVHGRNYLTRDLELATVVFMLKDYDFGLNYHPSKDNDVADTLSSYGH